MYKIFTSMFKEIYYTNNNQENSCYILHLQSQGNSWFAFDISKKLFHYFKIDLNCACIMNDTWDVNLDNQSHWQKPVYQVIHTLPMGKTITAAKMSRIFWSEFLLSGDSFGERLLPTRLLINEIPKNDVCMICK